MIRNAVIHVSNEQPLVADLYSVPTASDAGLVCTNVRMMDGKKPLFIDNTAATFFFPYLHLRFIEIPPGAMERHYAEVGESPAAAHGPSGAAPAAAEPTGASAGATGAATGTPDSRLPVLVTDPEPAAGEEGGLELDLDIDEDFLQRIRDI